mgnify:CR=1 FL=1
MSTTNYYFTSKHLSPASIPVAVAVITKYNVTNQYNYFNFSEHIP